MKLERACNHFLRDLSVAGNTNDEWHALDDDKDWLEQSGRNKLDTFTVMNTTHNRDNHKGIVAHTSVSTPMLVPLCFRFQRQGETVVDNFRLIFQSLYPGVGLGDNIPDLNGISNHSDRGYTSYETIFEFLNPAGCEFTNTIKRQFPNPFIWGVTKERQNDPRTKLDEKGCASVHLKSIVKSSQTISVHAFRTGTKKLVV